MHEIILGLVQGLTEFLPVSSSGHLVLVPGMLGWGEPPLGLTVLLHMGTLVALIIYFRNDILGLILGVLGQGPDVATSRRIVRFLIIGTVPAVIAGVALGGFFEHAFERPYESSIELFCTALILVATEKLGERAVRHELDDTRAGAIGVAQAVAILPGISRSGSTIGTGLLAGLSREEATRFSFLLSLPAIGGAGVLDLAKGDLVISAGSLTGTLVSGLVGFASIHYLLRFVRTHSLNVFAGYLFVFAPLSALVIWLR